jgi:hypothetical protein
MSLSRTETKKHGKKVAGKEHREIPAEKLEMCESEHLTRRRPISEGATSIWEERK